jgi:hypothetical protein
VQASRNLASRVKVPHSARAGPFLCPQLARPPRPHPAAGQKQPRGFRTEKESQLSLRWKGTVCVYGREQPLPAA